MGYSSDIYLKTTSEGFCILEELNNKMIEKGYREDDRLLYGFDIVKMKSGCYTLTAIDVKWYDEYMQVSNFHSALELLTAYDLPYVYYEIGEEIGDIEMQCNFPDDTPDEITFVTIERSITDDIDDILDVYDPPKTAMTEKILKEVFTKEKLDYEKIKTDLFKIFDEHLLVKDEIKEVLHSSKWDKKVIDLVLKYFYIFIELYREK